MKKILLVLTLAVMAVAISSTAFADEARDAMIAYSGTDTFASLLPEERQACMVWVSEGGVMSELCKRAVNILISEAPNAVTNSQRKALIAAAAGVSVRTRPQTQPIPETRKTEVKNDDTGGLIAVGLAAVVLGMVIHNNIGRSSSRHGPPPPPPHYRPAPAPRPMPRR